MEGVTQDRLPLGVVGVEVIAAAVVTVDLGLHRGEAVLNVRDLGALATAKAQSQGRALHPPREGNTASPQVVARAHENR